MQFVMSVAWFPDQQHRPKVYYLDHPVYLYASTLNLPLAKVSTVS